MSFLSCRVFKDEHGIQHRLVEQDDYPKEEGQVIINIQYSGVNYKDALGATGSAPIYKSFPINAGIDCAGTVEWSGCRDFNKGDAVFVNGCGLGELQDGGLSEKVSVPSDWVMPLPNGLDARSAMIYGTAGFTAALAIHRMIQNDQCPEFGPILVTGASGGVGSFAITMLAKLGYESIAVTGRPEHKDYLYSLGATEVKSSDELDLGNQPLEKAKFGGMIDSVGGDLLSAALRHINLWGNVASIGMAADSKFQTTVFPFILRGVSLLGTSSTNCPMPRRKQVWQWISRELLFDNLDLVVAEEIKLAEVSRAFSDILARKVRGRILVSCDSPA